MPLARSVALAVPLLIVPALALAQPGLPKPPAAPAPPAAIPPPAASSTAEIPAASAPTPSASAAAAAAPEPSTAPAITPAARNPPLITPTMLPAPPGGVTAASPMQSTGTSRGSDRNHGEVGAKPSDVFAEDWWNFGRPILELHGYFRVRAELFHNFSLGRIDPPDAALWPQPPDNSYRDWWGGQTSQEHKLALCGDDPMNPAGKNCQDKTQAGTNLRFRLNPELHLSDNLRILSQVDLLDNLVLGSTPGGYANTPTTVTNAGYWRSSSSGYAAVAADSNTQVPPTAGQNSYKNSIAVKRVWGEYVTPIGLFRFGRMPDHWGLGMVHNAGDTFDSDYQSTVDRFMFVSGLKALDLYVGGAWDFPHEGATSQNINQDQGQPYDLAQLDDVNQYSLILVRRRNPTLQRLELAQGDVVLNGGVYLTYRNQFLSNDVGSNGTGSTTGQNLGAGSDAIQQGYVRRNFSAWIPDLWFQLLYKKFRFEAETVMVQGSMENTPARPYRNTFDPTNNGWKLRQYGVATQTEFKAVEDRLRLNFGFGWSSGDPDVVGPQVGGLTPGNRGFQEQTTNNRAISTFRFHPDYRVDLILFRHILSRVQGAYYFRPAVDYDFSRNPNGQRLGGGLAVIWSRASEFVQTPGHRRDLGVEIDLSLYFQAKDGSLNDGPDKMGGFFTMLQYGVLFPLWGLDYMPGEKDLAATQQNLTLETSAAQTLRWYVGILF